MKQAPGNISWSLQLNIFSLTTFTRWSPFLEIGFVFWWIFESFYFWIKFYLISFDFFEQKDPCSPKAKCITKKTSCYVPCDPCDPCPPPKCTTTYYSCYPSYSASVAAAAEAAAAAADCAVYSALTKKEAEIADLSYTYEREIDDLESELCNTRLDKSELKTEYVASWPASSKLATRDWVYKISILKIGQHQTGTGLRAKAIQNFEHGPVGWHCWFEG